LCVLALSMSSWHFLLALLGNNHKSISNTLKRTPQKGKTTGKLAKPNEYPRKWKYDGVGLKRAKRRFFFVE